jgi:uncharacterized protein
MPHRKYNLHDGKKGAAIGVRITPRASKDEIAEIMADGTVRIRLTAQPNEAETNQALAAFLATVLGVSQSKVEVVAGQTGRDKLVSILDVDAEETHQKILANMS